MQQSATPDIRFSVASPTLVDKLLRHLAVRELEPLALPPSDHLLPPDGALTPFSWTRGQTEPAASHELLALLQSWVKDGLEPPITNAFMDVQGLASHAPMEIAVGKLGTFKGMCGMVVLRRGLTEDDIFSPLGNCALAVDWKHPSAFSLKATKPQAALQTIGLSRLLGGENSPPVFFTDMATGFRCWQLVESELGVYHGASGTADLTLAEGVALIRHFLVRDAELMGIQRARVLAVRDDSPLGAAGAGVSAPHAAAAGTGGPLATPLPAGKAGGGGISAAGNSPDDPAALLPEASSPEDEAATLLSITHGLAARWSTLGGLALADFCDES